MASASSRATTPDPDEATDGENGENPPVSHGESHPVHHEDLQGLISDPSTATCHDQRFDERAADGPRITVDEYVQEIRKVNWNSSSSFLKFDNSLGRRSLYPAVDLIPLGVYDQMSFSLLPCDVEFEIFSDLPPSSRHDGFMVELRAEKDDHCVAKMLPLGELFLRPVEPGNKRDTKAFFYVFVDVTTPTEPTVCIAAYTDLEDEGIFLTTPDESDHPVERPLPCTFARLMPVRDIGDASRILFDCESIISSTQNIIAKAYAVPEYIWLDLA